MKTICLSALFVFLALTAVMMIGRAFDQVHRDADCITNVSQAQPCQP